MDDTFLKRSRFCGIAYLFCRPSQDPLSLFCWGDKRSEGANLGHRCVFWMLSISIWPSSVTARCFFPPKFLWDLRVSLQHSHSQWQILQSRLSCRACRRGTLKSLAVNRCNHISLLYCFYKQRDFISDIQKKSQRVAQYWSGRQVFESDYNKSHAWQKKCRIRLFYMAVDHWPDDTVWNSIYDILLSTSLPSF